MTDKLLLPYAYNSLGELTHIDFAHKGEQYTCPTCGAELSLRISKIPEGEKYHRINHFAHKGCTDNHCSESFLHKRFKELAVEIIKFKLENGEKDMLFEWECDKCHETHRGNLLKKATSVISEYDLGDCKPDIALLDVNNKVIIVIEIVVKHKTSYKAIQYYDKNKIACLQIFISDFNDLNHVENILSRPTNVNLCPNPICDKCGQIKSSSKIAIKTILCPKCHTDLKLPIIITKYQNIYRPVEFTDKEIEIANNMGANIIKGYSQKKRKSYVANVCRTCKNIIGNFNIWEPYESERAIGYKCMNCKMLEEHAQYEAKRQKELKLIEILNKHGKPCPKCNGTLKVRNSANGYFWECDNYPVCKYTENINIEEDYVKP